MQALTFEPRVIKFGCMLILVVKCNVSYHETYITICIQIYVERSGSGVELWTFDYENPGSNAGKFVHSTLLQFTQLNK